MSLRIKVDENLPSEVTEALRSAGFDADDVMEEQLGGRPDTTIAEKCQQEKRAIITLDMDFADIRKYPPAGHSGLIVLRLAKQDKPSVLGVVTRLIPLLQSENVAESPWIVDETSVRFRFM